MSDTVYNSAKFSKEVFLRSLFAILLCIEFGNCQNKQTTNIMPECRKVPVISTAKEFEQILSGFLNPNKTLAVLLDYDGTLSPISDDPNKTVMPFEIDDMLHKLSLQPNVFLAVISGRGLKDVQSKVGIKGITYAGNHGLEIELPNGTHHDYQLPADIQANYRKLVEQLQKELAINNAVVEDKKFSLTYHYRHTPEEYKEQQKKRAIEIIKAYGFRANQAHEAIEAKPPVEWNKGEAARFILQTKFGDKWAEEVNVIFAGDDTTDEDAMKILQGYGKSFRISSDPNIQTYADFRLPQQHLMKDLLTWVGSVYVC